MNCMCMGQLWPFVCSECISLFRSNTMENSLTVNKAISKISNGILAGLLLTVKANPSPACVSIPKRTNCFSFCDRSIKCNQIVTSWLLVHLGNITISVAQCHFLLLTWWILTSSYSHIIHSELKPMLLSPCIISMPASSATCFLCSFKQWMQWLGKEIHWHAHNGPSCPHNY